MVAVDNTTATAYLQQPLALGATYVVASDTRGLTGHSDVILGHVATADPERPRPLRTGGRSTARSPDRWRSGASCAADAAVALDRASAPGERLAEFLAGHAAVTAVHYPGLP